MMNEMNLKDFPVLFKLFKLMDTKHCGPKTARGNLVVKPNYLDRFIRAEKSLKQIVGVRATKLGIKDYGPIWIGEILVDGEATEMKKIVRHFKLEVADRLFEIYFNDEKKMFDLDYRSYYRFHPE